MENLPQIGICFHTDKMLYDAIVKEAGPGASPGGEFRGADKSLRGAGTHVTNTTCGWAFRASARPRTDIRLL